MEECTVEVYEDGSKRWYLDGKLHREDGPAFEHANGRKDWYLNGERHREDGPAIEWADGTKFWYLNGQRHREDGPAVEWSDGSKEWRVKGQLHREDGPAVEWSDGTKKWWLHNKRVTEEEHKRRTSGGPRERHRCELHSQSGGHGEAVDVCFEDEDGKLWVENGEYASVVYFCPACGYASRAKAKGE